MLASPAAIPPHRTGSGVGVSGDLFADPLQLRLIASMIV
jgi:hypothetical protein